MATEEQVQNFKAKARKIMKTSIEVRNLQLDSFLAQNFKKLMRLCSRQN